MARPKSDNPRSEIVKLRVTVGEKARIEAAAAAGGQAVADYMRGRVLDAQPMAGLLEPTTVSVSTVPPRGPGGGLGGFDETLPEDAPAPRPKPEERMPSAHDRTAWWCPEALCNRRSRVKGERCPVHGTAMTLKSRGA